ncbi:MAG: hypothetical protein K0S65_5061, partial [Labilithrix sp.]|nr:hypothetical protein [Labilithrix sp.]
PLRRILRSDLERRNHLRSGAIQPVRCPSSKTFRHIRATVSRQPRAILTLEGESPFRLEVFEMRKTMIALLGAGALAGCSGTTATSDPATQTQAQSVTVSDGGAEARRPPGHHHHGPPAEAFAACSSKAAGDACSVTLDKDSLAGTCVNPPADAPDARIVCRPDKMPEHGPGGHGGRPPGPPPAEVFTACEGKAADAACSVTFGDRTIEGTCKAAPPGMNETRLGCAPSHPPPPPPR